MKYTADVAIASDERFSFEGFSQDLCSKTWCINLEGAIASKDSKLPSWGVYNAHDALDSFAQFNLGPVFLGNNHIHDIHDGVWTSKNELIMNGLSSFGAGKSTPDASRAVEVYSGKQRFVLLGFGWPVIGCVSAGAQKPGVNRLEGRHALLLAEQAILTYQGARVVIVIHGNYEFERYPQPAHRSLAKKLIDLGVYAVIFHHPHIVGPVGRYRNRTIAYSLGNWAFSFGKFFDGKLQFPESSFHQIALDLGEDSDVVHHARFKPPSTVCYERSEQVHVSDFSLRPAFEGFDDDAYLNWFKANRIKRKGLPIYRDANDSVSNWLRDRWVMARQIVIDTAAKAGLKTMRSRT